jgi:peroxiredoxin
LVLIAGAVAVVFAINGARNARVAAEAVAAGDDPYLFDLDGECIELSQVLHEGVVVWIYTRSDCPISNRYAPEVRELYEKFHSQGVIFYLIYVDARETAENIRAHLAEYQYPCPALHDPDHTTVRLTEVSVTPEAVIFDTSGRITYRGRINDLFVDAGNSRASATTHDLADAIEATLAGRPVARPVTKAVGCYIVDLKQ